MKPFLEIFDCVYVLNLPERSDRRREMAAEFVRIGSSLDAANVTVFPAIRPVDRDGFDSIGARGCFLSQLGILQDAARAGHQRILLLEDDANFAADFAARTPALAAALAGRDWGIFYGGCRLAPGMPQQPDADGLAEIAAESELLLAHFVAFQGPAIGALGPYLQAMLSRPAGDPQGGPMHVDGAYNWFRRAHPAMRTLLAVPEIGYQRASRTDIHATAWHDRTPLVRDLAALARRWRNRQRMA